MRLCTPSFSKIRCPWLRTVACAIENRLAIAVLFIPRAKQRRISRSRSVNLPFFNGLIDRSRRCLFPLMADLLITRRGQRRGQREEGRDERASISSDIRVTPRGAAKRNLVHSKSEIDASILLSHRSYRARGGAYSDRLRGRCARVPRLLHDLDALAEDVGAEAGDVGVGELVPPAAGVTAARLRVAGERDALPDLLGQLPEVGKLLHLGSREVSASADHVFPAPVELRRVPAPEAVA